MVNAAFDPLDLFGRRYIPAIVQSEAAECGLACIAMILAAHGDRRDLSSLRRSYPVSLKGTSLSDLIQIADAVGLAARAVRFELGELGDLKRPAVLHWDLDHFVVLDEVKSGGRIVVLDPARGRRALSLAEASKHITGVGLEFTPTQNFRKQNVVQRVHLGDLWSRQRGITSALAKLFLLAGILQLFALAGPFYSQLVVDEAITKGDLGILNILALGFGLLMVLQTAITVLRSYVGLHFSTALTYQMRVNLFRHLTRLPVSWFENRHIGDIVSRFGSMGPVQTLFTSGIVAVVLDGLMAVTTLALMLVYSPLLTGIVVGALCFAFIGQLAIFPVARRQQEEQLHISARENSLFLETIRAARTIKIFGREPERLAVWQNAYSETVDSRLRISRFGINTGVGGSMLSGIENIIILYVGAKLVMAGTFTLGMLFAFQAYRSQFVGAASALIGQFIQYRMLGLHLERLADIVHADPEPGTGESLTMPGPVHGAMALKNVSFRYAPTEPAVLNGVDLHVRAGECVVITGASGCGKSTLIKLLLGLHLPSEGQILVDGLPLHTLGVARLRAAVGVVQQDDTLLSGTIADNISFFDTEVNLDWVRACAVAASVAQDIEAMPMAYQSLVGDMGTALSGGQKQRILLARALYRKPRILILDEGTANLDPATEQGIIGLLDQLPMTRIIVAHRPAVFEIAGRIMALRNGKLVEIANHGTEAASVRATVSA